jgi:hypothetical protein
MHESFKHGETTPFLWLSTICDLLSEIGTLAIVTPYGLFRVMSGICSIFQSQTKIINASPGDARHGTSDTKTFFTGEYERISMAVAASK